MLRGARAEHQRARPGESGAIVRSFANITVQCIVKRVSAERGRFDKWGGARMAIPHPKADNRGMSTRPTSVAP